MQLENNHNHLSRNSYIDLIKGILIILVVIGHVLPGTLNENLARYVIYSFHMPVFFMMSGYLFNPRNVCGVKKFWHKYIRRIVLPWSMAIIVYYLLNAYVNMQSVSMLALIKEYIRPYYHLWYVWGFLFCIISCLIIMKIDHSKYILGLVLGLAGAAGQFCVGMIQRNAPEIGKVADIIYYTIRPQFFLFFMIGMWIHKRNIRIKKRYLYFNSVLLGIMVVLSFFSSIPELISTGIKYIFSILLFLLIMGNPINKMENKWVVFIGRHSFYIYLWHVVGKIMALHLCNGMYNLAYYVICIIWCILLLFILTLRENLTEERRNRT